MLSQVLISAEKDPTCLIGGRLPLIESHGRAGKSDIFVCEACEYKNHYHELSPDTAILLNVDEDHLEFFGNLQNIKASFNKFCSLCSKSVIYKADDKNTVDTVSDLKVKKISFGEHPSTAAILRRASRTARDDARPAPYAEDGLPNVVVRNGSIAARTESVIGTVAA